MGGDGADSTSGQMHEERARASPRNSYGDIAAWPTRALGTRSTRPQRTTLVNIPAMCVPVTCTTYRHTGLPAFRYTDVQAYRYTGIQTYRHTGMQAYRQGCRLYAHARRQGGRPYARARTHTHISTDIPSSIIVIEWHDLNPNHPLHHTPYPLILTTPSTIAHPRAPLLPSNAYARPELLD